MPPFPVFTLIPGSPQRPVLRLPLLQTFGIPSHMLIPVLRCCTLHTAVLCNTRRDCGSSSLYFQRLPLIPQPASLCHCGQNSPRKITADTFACSGLPARIRENFSFLQLLPSPFPGLRILLPGSVPSGISPVLWILLLSGSIPASAQICAATVFPASGIQHDFILCCA